MEASGKVENGRGISPTIRSSGWPQDYAGATLTIDLDALVENYHIVKNIIGDTICSAVLKDDAYGVGAHYIAPALYGAGVREFFVAYSLEGIALRSVLPGDANITVLHEPTYRSPSFWHRHQLRPMFNDYVQLQKMAQDLKQDNQRLTIGIQINSGMSRFGLSRGEVKRAQKLFCEKNLSCALVISHLACASSPDNPANERQRRYFESCFPYLPKGARKSLAASDGIFLGKNYFFDLVRPGIILYGMAPASGLSIKDKLRPVLSLDARILQVHTLKKGEAVGYDHLWTAPKESRIAVIATGYADGIAWENQKGLAWYKHYPLPFVGRVSMDCAAIDVSALPQGELESCESVSLLNEHYNLNEVTKQCGCTAYEILTSLSRRYHRRYCCADLSL